MYEKACLKLSKEPLDAATSLTPVKLNPNWINVLKITPRANDAAMCPKFSRPTTCTKYGVTIRGARESTPFNSDMYPKFFENLTRSPRPPDPLLLIFIQAND